MGFHGFQHQIHGGFEDKIRVTNGKTRISPAILGIFSHHDQHWWRPGFHRAKMASQFPWDFLKDFDGAPGSRLRSFFWQKSWDLPIFCPLKMATRVYVKTVSCMANNIQQKELRKRSMWHKKGSKAFSVPGGGCLFSHGSNLELPTWPVPLYSHYPLIWVNYNLSLPWIKAILGWFPLLNMIIVRSQWGRYNLPRLISPSISHDIQSG